MEKTYRVAILTSSDSGYAGKRTDLSGPKIKEICEAYQFQVVAETLLPDDETRLSQQLATWCDSGEIDLVLTTGGTGLSPRDLMPEATLAIGERNVPGIAEAMRSFSLQITKHAMLSRGVAVIRKETLVVNLPGSVKAVTESLTYIIEQLPHALGILQTPVEESKKHE